MVKKSIGNLRNYTKRCHVNKLSSLTIYHDFVNAPYVDFCRYDIIINIVNIPVCYFLETIIFLFF